MTAGQTRVAVVGSGVAGLTAAYVASRTAHVTLFEADDRLGGHADTHQVDSPDGPLGIDTGFIVHNPRTYPVLLRMFAELGVATQPSEMSMSIRDDGTGLEWAGALGRLGLFPTSANLRNPRYLAMLTEIPRFHRRARKLLAGVSTSPTTHAGSTSEGGTDVPLREFLDAGRFSAYFVRHFMEPLVAAVWSCDPEVALDYPARYLFTFLQHHGMLGIFGSPQWRTVTGGSGAYVAKVEAELPDIRTGTKVTSVLETPSGVQVTDGNGQVTTYDAVVIATHPGQALAMLAEPTATQRELLTAMPYSPNTALLHTDASLMPQARNAWASWNFTRLEDDRAGVVVTYDLTRLQRLATDTHYFVTLGGEDLVDPATVIERMEYEHPLYNPTSVAAQARLPEIDTGRVAFAGAYHGWGFHEDGARSGLAAVERLGFAWPSAERTEPVDAPAQRHLRDHHPAHATHAVRPLVHASVADLAGRRRRPAGPRRARSLRGPRPHRRPRADAPRERPGLPRPARRSTCAAGGCCWPPTRGPSATASTRSASSGAGTAPASSRPRWSRCTTPTVTGTPTSSTPTSRDAAPSTRPCTSRRSTAPTAPTGSPLRSRATVWRSR